MSMGTEMKTAPCEGWRVVAGGVEHNAPTPVYVEGGGVWTVDGDVCEGAFDARTALAMWWSNRPKNAGEADWTEILEPGQLSCAEIVRQEFARCEGHALAKANAADREYDACHPDDVETRANALAAHEAANEILSGIRSGKSAVTDPAPVVSA